MANKRRLLSDSLDTAKRNIQSVASSARVSLTAEELGLLDEAIFIIIEAKIKISQIKEEFIRTIDECSL